jgi:hypothetical protein
MLSAELEIDRKRLTLIIFLRPRLTLAITDFRPGNGFDADGDHFRDDRRDEWTGFYDWLRDPEGQLVGIRYCPFEYLESLIEKVESFSYARSVPGRYLEIFFSSLRNLDQSRSGDQAFEYDQVFLSERSEYAIAFGMKSLSTSDVERLRQANADWKTVEAGSPQ